MVAVEADQGADYVPPLVLLLLLLRPATGAEDALRDPCARPGGGSRRLEPRTGPLRPQICGKSPPPLPLALACLGVSPPPPPPPAPPPAAASAAAGV